MSCVCFSGDEDEFCTSCDCYVGGCIECGPLYDYDDDDYYWGDEE